MAWKGDQLADMVTALSKSVPYPSGFANKRIYLPPVAAWVLLYGLSDYCCTAVSIEALSTALQQTNHPVMRRASELFSLFSEKQIPLHNHNASCSRVECLVLSFSVFVCQSS